MSVVLVAPGVGNVESIAGENSMNHKKHFSSYCYLGSVLVQQLRQQQDIMGEKNRDKGQSQIKSR